MNCGPLIASISITGYCLTRNTAWIEELQVTLSEPCRYEYGFYHPRMYAERCTKKFLHTHL